MPLIEVAETSIDFDRAVKLPLYARHDVPEEWLIDLQHKALTIHRTPLDGMYRETLQPPDLTRVAPLQLPQAVLDVSDLLCS